MVGNWCFTRVASVCHAEVGENGIYRVIQEERLTLWEAIVLVIMRKTKFMDMCLILNGYCSSVAYPRILFGEGGSRNSVEERGQREWGSGGDSLLVRDSGGSHNLVQEISFHIVKFSLRLFI